MKTLILAVTLSGCIISSDDSGSFCGDHITDPGEACDDGNNTSGDGCSATCELEVTPHTTHAAWQVQDIDGANAGCPAGFDTAAVVAWKVDADLKPIGACAPGGQPSDTCYLSYFDCVDGSGTTGPIPDNSLYPDATGGSFLTFVAITSHDHAAIYAQSLSDVLDLTSGDKSFPADADHLHGTIYNDGGYFTATWTLKGKNSGSTLSCDTAGSGAVSILSTVTGGSQGVDDIFRCEDFANPYIWTKALRADSYTVSVKALDKGDPGGAIGPATSLANAVIEGKNGVTDLGALVLTVDD